MYTLRYPLLPSVDSLDSDSNSFTPSSSATASELTQASHIPSLSGLAFAIVAASLPLLKARDVTIASAILSLIRIVGVYIVEPEVILVGASHCSDEALLLSSKRVQHVFNRIEQVFLFRSFNDYVYCIIVMIELYCAVLCCAVLYSNVLSCAVLCCAVMCCDVLCCSVLCCSVLCSAVMCRSVLCCNYSCFIAWNLLLCQLQPI